MDSSILTLLSDRQLLDLLRRYDLEANPKLLSSWHALTFEVKKNGTPFILRVTDSTHRTKSEIEGELAWMIFLKKNGLSVPAVFPSRSNLLAESISVNKVEFNVVCFEKLGGRRVAENDWNAPLFEKWGRLVGQLHRLSRGSLQQSRRPEWHQSDFLNVEKYIPDDEPLIKNAARELISDIKGLETDSRFARGLMHADVYQDNFFVEGNDLQLFDFDNCERGFLVNDWAISVYAALWKVPASEDRQKFAIEFFTAFRKGYEREFQLRDEEIRLLPLFLRLRDVLIYIVTRKKRDLNNLNPAQSRLLHERGARIAAKLPVIDVSGACAAQK